MSEIKDGKYYNAAGLVAVLVSPGYGAGWYSWNSDITECLFDPEIVQAVIDEDYDKVTSLAESKWPAGYWGGPRDLEVGWLSPGTKFRINEYDGSEGIVTYSNDDFLVA